MRGAATTRRRTARTQRGEPTARDPIYDLPLNQRRRLRRAEEQGRREGEQRAATTEQAAKEAALAQIPEWQTRPRNQWRDLIELRKPDAWRKDVAHRIKVYEKEAQIEDERIDRLMEEKQKRHELESAPEYAKALAHWERASANADAEERQEFARLRGLIDGGGAAHYWDQVMPLMQARLTKVQAAIIEQAGKQQPLAQGRRCRTAESSRRIASDADRHGSK